MCAARIGGSGGHFRKRRREFGGLCNPERGRDGATAGFFARSGAARRLRLGDQ
jgi:hypothetical protein